MLRGDRPLLLVLIGAVVLALLVIVGPLEQALVARERIAALEAKAAALEAENVRLERRITDLDDPATVELLAREQLGLVRPGEVPYVLIAPEVDRQRILDPIVPEPAPAPDLWSRLLDLIQQARG